VAWRFTLEFLSPAAARRRRQSRSLRVRVTINKISVLDMLFGQKIVARSHSLVRAGRCHGTARDLADFA